MSSPASSVSRWQRKRRVTWNTTGLRAAEADILGNQQIPLQTLHSVPIEIRRIISPVQNGGYNATITRQATLFYAADNAGSGGLRGAFRAAEHPSKGRFQPAYLARAASDGGGWGKLSLLLDRK